MSSAIGKRTTGDVAPMSFAQELLWLLDRATPGLTAYNVPRAMRLRGELNHDALRRSLERLVERHEILRTTYASDARGTVQVVHEPRRFDLPVADLSRLPEDERMPAAEQFFLEQARTPFDLTKDRLLRGFLLRLDANDHVLVLVTHHIASDGWSKGVMFRELSEGYEAYARGEEPASPALPVQYADFSIWQREQVEGGSLAEPLEYWHKRLASPLPSLELPTDFPRPAVPSFNGAREAIVLPASLVSKLRELGMDHGATQYMVLLAAYHTVLHRYSGQDDIITGSPIAGRNETDVEGLIGYFANTLAMRTSFEGDPTFAELLERIAENAVDAYEHEDVPFEKLVLELREKHEAQGDTPLFSCVLTMEDTLPDELRLGDVKVETIAIDFGMSKFDLTLLVAELAEGLRLALWYRTDLFTTGFAQRFLGHVRNVLEEATAHPDVKISAMRLMSADEARQVAEWNETDDDSAPAATIIDLFEKQVSRVPGRPAVVTKDATLTYAQLAEASDRVAEQLSGAGVERGSAVGLLLDRSADAVVGMFGIMKAAGAYMPLSVDAPAARLEQQLAESGARVVLTDDDGARRLPDSVVVVKIGGDVTSHAKPVLPGVDDVAYVLYTSGSTGTPKGVEVTHANVVHYTRGVTRVLGDVDCLHFGLVSTLAADLGNTSVYPALLNGGTLHVLAKGETTEPASFAEYVRAHPLDVLKVTPNHLMALVAGRTGRELGAVLPSRWIVLGGEALRPDVARALLGAESCRVLNHYGPTETTVGACTYEVTSESLAEVEKDGAQTVPIGRPLANVQLHVLDANRNQVPVGIPGELYIGGNGVARGYRGRDDLTAERFVSAAQVQIPPLRAARSAQHDTLYKTGDRVRRLANGAIEFRGRTDDQVKVRGYRVELGEIEQALVALRGVSQAAVALHGGGDAEPRLVAYVVAQNEGYSAAHTAKVTPEEITASLAERLPEYMVPSSVVLLDALPITANGKIDRRALPDPEAGKVKDEFVEPATDTERALSAIWMDVLKKERIGTTESFMTLGGHSLLAIRVLGKLSRQFGVRLPLRSLFDTPTIGELARVVDAEVDAVKQRELAAALASLEGMSDEEAARLAAQNGPS
ncbi:MAG: amino acid adenylation domain-containing protein [Gemmatimonadaceae bacterium]